MANGGLSVTVQDIDVACESHIRALGDLQYLAKQRSNAAASSALEGSQAQDDLLIWQSRVQHLQHFDHVFACLPLLAHRAVTDHLSATGTIRSIHLIPASQTVSVILNFFPPPPP